MKTRDELWDWVWKDGWEPPPEGEDEAARAVAEELVRAPEEGEDWVFGSTPVTAPETEAVLVLAEPEAPVESPPQPPGPASFPWEPALPQPEVAPRVRPERVRRTERRRLRRRVLRAAVAALLAVGAAVVIIAAPQSERSPGTDRDGVAMAPPEQSVVAWTVWDQRRPGASFVAILATGGGLDPVAVPVPGNAATSIPGHGVGTIDDAAATGDIATVAATLENVLGVQVDDGWGIPLSALGRLVDELGTVPVEGRFLDGDRVMAYLREPGLDLGTERAIRWQAVLTGLVEATDAASALDLDVPPAARPVFAEPATEVLPLPVEDVGAGLSRPDAEGVAALVTERFVPTDGGTKVRLVVLNGNGEPGVGQRVARLLVPQGYQLVASQNASEFGMAVTRIIASDREDLPAARKAQRLLGVGRVLLGTQHSGVAEVTVVVGLDFGGP